MSAHLLLASGELATLERLAAVLRAAGHTHAAARDPERLLALARSEAPELCLLDGELPGLAPALATLAALEDPPHVVLVGRVPAALAGHERLAAASEQELAALLASTLERARLLRERLRLRRREERRAARVLVGSDPSTRRLAETVQHVAAASGATVLLLGEPGSGRRRVARAIHAASPQAAGPFAELDLARATGEAARELFGSASGPLARRRGLLAESEGGSLALVGAERAPRELQRRLVRLLAEGTWRPDGEELDRPLRTRLLFVGGPDLAALERRVAEGTLDPDLLYRWNVLSLDVPRLAERSGALPALTAAFLEELAEEAGVPVPVLSPAALARIQERAWPGGIAELEHALEGARLASGGGAIEPRHLPGERAVEPPEGSELRPLPRSLRAVEADCIRRVLDEEHGNRTRAARVLGIHRATLYHKLREHGLA